MINTSIKYIVYTHSGGGVRHHHFSTQNNIIDEATGHASAGDTLNALGFAVQDFNGTPVNFAFMSVNGAADGNHLYTSPGNHTVPVGTTDIAILVVYAPPGGIGGPHGPGIWVDAFNVDTGQFSDSLDFIKVLTPPTPPDTVDAAATTFSNQDGTVLTDHAENVRANTHVDGVPFVEWKQIVGASTIQNTTDLHLSAGQTGQIWFAFYQTTDTSSPGVKIAKIVQLISAGIFVWTGDDTCGNGGHWIGPGHGPGPAPFKISLSRQVLAGLSAEQQKQVRAIMAAYPKQAEAALSQMSDALGSLQSLSQILSKGKSIGK
ncbi:MAG: hypothetical protein JST12_11800 [Armatimonadetes bacterium]|nr:hypothetical protein [Armatimonadota bacterium]MBS1702338.1 hypothetical protein [Armatimonadota bacterium]MBS1726334.1 hypothetical protein [Armatimonadota bacterium]